MKFKKFGKALLMSALSTGVILSVTSCIQSYTVGFLYVTGTVTSQSTGNGIISGFKIDHNTGKLTPINGLPIGSGGANPVRAVLITGSRFIYVLNRGTTASGGADCTTADPCQNANITTFAVGSNGILTSQETFYTQGINPFRMVLDSTGSFLYVLDHDSAVNSAPSSAKNPNPNCALALGAGVTTCGDITVFQINSTTGRLSLIVNAQVTAASGQALPYFPVPSNPIDFLLASNNVLVLTGTPATGDYAFPYASGAAGTGQLTVTQNSAQPLNINNATAIVNGGILTYVLDNEPVTVNGATSPSQLIPYLVSTGGALQAQTGGAIADDPSESNPIYLLRESKGNFLYLLNQGNNLDTTNSQSGIAGYVINKTTTQLTPTSPSTFGTGAGPQCIVEDPSNQFIYSADFNDSQIYGRRVNPTDGTLTEFVGVPLNYSVSGPATWCLVDGRTS